MIGYREVLYSDSMAAPSYYIRTILDAARKSGRSEREISRAATGQPAALSLLKTGRVPSVERVRQLCEALDLEFYIGPRRESYTSPKDFASPPPSWTLEPTADEPHPPWVDALLFGMGEEMAKIVGNLMRNPPAGVEVEDKAAHGRAALMRQLVLPVAHTDPDQLTAMEKGVAQVGFKFQVEAAYGVNPAQCTMLGVYGESMEPTVPHGSVILIDCNQRRRRDGGVFVVRMGDDLVLRRAREDADDHWLLASDRSEWSDLPWTERTVVVGEVKWVATPLD